MAEEKVFNIPLKTAFDRQRRKRASNAIKIVREFLVRNMKAGDVKIGNSINASIWEERHPGYPEAGQDTRSERGRHRLCGASQHRNKNPVQGSLKKKEDKKKEKEAKIKEERKERKKKTIQDEIKEETEGKPKEESITQRKERARESDFLDERKRYPFSEKVRYYYYSKRYSDVLRHDFPDFLLLLLGYEYAQNSKQYHSPNYARYYRCRQL